MKFSRRGLGANYLATRKEESFFSDVYQQAISRISELADDSETPSDSSLLLKVKFVASDSSQSERHNDSLSERILNNSDLPTAKKSIKRKHKDVFKETHEVIERVKLKKQSSLTMKKSKDSSKSSVSEQPLYSLSDTRLLQLGEGRTGHPAARFGIRCGGKLARAAEFL